MAIGLPANFKIFPDQFYGGFNEIVAQNGNAFNQASANALRLYTEAARGMYQEEAFFDKISGLVSRRDITTQSDATSVLLSADSIIAPKLLRKIGPVDNALGAFRTSGLDFTEDSAQARFSFLLGQQYAEDALVDMLNTALSGAVTVTGKAATTRLSIVGASGTKTLNYATGLIPGLGLFGDRGQDIVAWVMHSKPFYDLMGSNIAVATDRVAGATIYEGTAGTLGRPVVVTDSASLVKTDGGGTGINSYYTLGIREGGVDVKMTEDTIVYSEIVTGKAAGLVLRVQGEYAYNLRLLGYSMTTDGNVNPTGAEIADAGNWTQQFASHKWTLGARIETL